MRGKRSKVVLLGVAACCASAAAWLLAGPATATVTKQQSAKVTVVTVTLGKPSEFGIKLSKFSNLPTGAITFKVVNKGKAQHDFKVCSVPAKTTANNACNGKVTKRLNAGQSGTLTVTFLKKGTYEFLCTVPGHAKIGMKGLLGIKTVVTAAAGGNTAGQTTTTTPAAGAGAGGAGAGGAGAGGAGAGGAGAGGAGGTTCASPTRATTVPVGMNEYSFQMQTTIPCGTVTFVETNNGVLDHNINILGAAGGSGPIIHQGDTARFTVSLNPGTYNTQCDVPEHAVLGMVGQITVTP